MTTSGAGLDPHVSPEAARYQAARVAAARGVAVDRVQKLIDDHVDRSGAIIGAPARVNVLLLNLDLDKEIPADAKPADDKTADARTAPSPRRCQAGRKPADAKSADVKLDRLQADRR